MLRVVAEQRSQLMVKDAYIDDLEDYIDNLLVKVMETQPKLLQNPYVRPVAGGITRKAKSKGSKNKTTVSNELPCLSTLSSGIYVADTNSNNNNPETSFTTISPREVKNSKSNQRNGNPVKFFQSLIRTN